MLVTDLNDLIRPDRYPRSSGYDPAWLLNLDMGPNPLWLLEDLARDLDLRPGVRILDLLERQGVRLSSHGRHPVADTRIGEDGCRFLKGDAPARPGPARPIPINLPCGTPSTSYPDRRPPGFPAPHHLVGVECAEEHSHRQSQRLQAQPHHTQHSLLGSASHRHSGDSS
ncbi:hypothetical protein GCM10010277_87360 [Streptomyces longisporoflavus]|nr:hypothetical protein GCM10010277_87360 [Streptomyces longisporoflavus]